MWPAPPRFEHANLRGATFLDVDLSGCHVNDARIENAKLEKFHLKSLLLDDANLANANSHKYAPPLRGARVTHSKKKIMLNEFVLDKDPAERRCDFAARVRRCP